MANYLSSKELEEMMTITKDTANELHKAIEVNQENLKALYEYLLQKISNLEKCITDIKNSKNNARKHFKSE
jgi:prefoldin subunit 5